MAIKQHKLDWAEYIASPNVSAGVITPKFLVMHYTAGYTAQSAINTFKNRSSQVSAQLIIDRDGKTTQMVPFNRRAWHAGPSSSHGYRDLNTHSIGFEFVGIGYLRKTSNGFIDPYGRAVTDKIILSNPMIEAPQPKIGSGNFFWPVYPEEQLAAGERAVKDILAKYPTVEYIVTHEEIDSRGWKTDPGPAFPMQRFRQLLEGAHGGRETSGEAIYQATTVLNVRAGAGTQWDRIHQFQTGARFKKLDQVGEWLFVEWDSGKRSGWVHGFYTRKVA